MAPPSVGRDDLTDGGDPFASFGDSIDVGTFEQILEMDDEDEDDRDFSRGLVFGFFEQAEGTFTEIEEALQKEDLPKLSALGHFLKGSSATLGLKKVSASCEKIQHYGAEDSMTDETYDSDGFLKLIREELVYLKEEHEAAKTILFKFYGE